jgi:hypothetical protein
MEFSSYSKKWEVQGCSENPEELVKSVLEACAEYLPDTALGHLKGFLEFDKGSVFASSSLIPPEITLRTEGEYNGGDMVLGATLIFMDLDVEFLSDILSRAAMEVCGQLGCKFKDTTEVLQWK